MNNKCTNLEETISFYTRNDYAIINNLLCGNMEELWKRAEIAINDNDGVIKEFENGERKITCDNDVTWIEIMKKRLFANLSDEEKKQKIIEVAKNDIANILDAMKPAEKEITLYRTIKHGNSSDLNYKIGDIIEFKIISSTSVNPIWENEDFDFYKYEIIISENSRILELDQFGYWRNEEGEILLPPMKCKVKNIRNDDNPKCKGIIELLWIEEILMNLM